MKGLSVVIPVYNEEKSVGQTISQLKKELDSFGIEYEIIAVNDASNDQSEEILKNLDYIDLISHPINKGYGAALKTGIKNSQYDWVLIIDADGTYPIHSIPEFLKNTDKYDLITGRRDTSNSAIPFERKFAKKFLNKFASYLTSKKIPDLNSGLRIFKKEIVLKYWELFPDGFSFTSTLTMVCLTHGYETKFIPIDYYKRKGKSSIKSTDFLSFLKLITKLSLFFKPIKVFGPLSLIMLLIAFLLGLAYYTHIISVFLDTTFIILCATALQTFFFGLLAEIVIHNK